MKKSKTATLILNKNKTSDAIPAEKVKALAFELLRSYRGNYIVGRALYETAKRIREEEPSDCADMTLIGEQLFPLGWASAQAMEHHIAKGQKTKAKSGGRK